MNENYEQKYKEDLEAAKGWLTIAKENDNRIAIQILENLFPELKESEDEMIRRSLLSFLNGLSEFEYPSKEEYVRWIAWLEKQNVLTDTEFQQGKEDVLWCIEQAKKNAKDENEMGTCWLAEQWLKNLRPQPKQEWGEEDEEKIKLLDALCDEEIKQCCKGSTMYREMQETKDWLKSFRPQKPAEKKELKKIEQKPVDIEIPFGAKDSELCEAVYHIPEGFHAEIEGNRIVIKQDENKPAEWSEEDDKRFNEILSVLDNESVLTDEEYSFLCNIRPRKQWIYICDDTYIKEPILAQKKDKSDIFNGYVICADHTLVAAKYERYLKLSDITGIAQKQWKPSKEQLSALFEAHKQMNADYHLPLITLYNDLKNL